MTSWPGSPDSWLVDYVAWRINSGKAATRPASIPVEVPTYAIDFLYWCIWRRKARPSPRPPFPTTIPKWAYELLEQVNKRAPIQLPLQPADYILPWAIWRFTPVDKRPPEPPPSVPDEITVAAPYCFSFLNWAAWRRRLISDPTAPRPKNIPANIPAWCFDHLRKINQAVRPGDPPPPPPPPDPDVPPSSWALPNPTLYTTWGWGTDYLADDTMLRQAKANGIKSIGLQGGQYGTDVPGRCRAHGLHPFLWGRARPQDEEDIIVGRLEGYMPQTEGPGEHLDALAALRAGAGLGLSLGTVTTLGAFTTFIRRPPTESHPEGKLTTVEVEQLREVGVNYGSVEVYKQEGPHFPISKMMWAADQRGLDHFDPLLGLYWETSLNVYRPAEDPLSLDNHAPEVGFYMAEGFIPVNWVEIKALVT